MTERRRADRLLVERGLFESRARAQAAIAAGRVSANGVVVSKASDEIAIDAAVEALVRSPDTIAALAQAERRQNRPQLLALWVIAALMAILIYLVL